MPKYEKVFKKLLEQDIPPEAMSDAEAFDASMEPGTDPETFSVEPGAPGYAQKYVEKAKTWIAHIDEFSDFVNGTESDSLNKQFIDLDYEGSPFEGISKASHTLTRIAEDLAALTETVKGYIITADKKEQQNNMQQQM